MSHLLELRHPRGTCFVSVGRGIGAESRELLGSWLAGRTVFVVSSRPVLDLHGGDLDPLFAGAGRRVDLVVPDGEGAKTLEVAEELWRQMAAERGKRDSRLVAFGGGSVGDVGGFVAGCFLRGIRWCPLPTTLLAQVDAAIGGKTAVDLPEGKNAVGLFHHPDRVVADTGWLSTLSPAERRAGLMEVVKMAFTLDRQLFDLVEEHWADLLEGSSPVLPRVVAGSVAAKIRVVEADPEEGGRRMVLNFGHTLGHAIEATVGYDRILHGDAVGWGMRFALRLARRRSLRKEAAERLERLLDRAELPHPGPLDADELMAYVGRDKKRREDRATWVLPRDVGAADLVGDLEDAAVHEALRSFVREVGAGDEPA